MNKLESKVFDTTQHIANKILQLRRAYKLTQESFAEKVNLDRRTIARAEEGKHMPAPSTLEAIALEFCVPICYFYDDSVYKVDVNKTALIYQINTKLNVLTKSNLKKVLSFIDILD